MTKSEKTGKMNEEVIMLKSNRIPWGNEVPAGKDRCADCGYFYSPNDISILPPCIHCKELEHNKRYYNVISKEFILEDSKFLHA
jgi:hypothetical protein